MSKVIPLRGEIQPGTPDPEIIKTLERLLEEARAGEVSGLAYAVVRPCGSQATGWDGISGTRHLVGTAIMMLNARYAQALLKDRTS